MSAAARAGVAGQHPRRAASSIARLLSTLLLALATAALIAVLVAGAAGIRIRVERTGSMAPALQPGDLVLVRSTAIEQIRPGDVIGVRQASGQVIVHRAERIDASGPALLVRTRGDANPAGEDWTIPRGEHVALVKGSVPSLGGMIDAVQGPLLAGAVMLAALALAGMALRSVWSTP